MGPNACITLAVKLRSVEKKKKTSPDFSFQVAESEVFICGCPIKVSERGALIFLVLLLMVHEKSLPASCSLACFAVVDETEMQ